MSGSVGKFGDWRAAISGSGASSGSNSLYLTEWWTGNENIYNITAGGIKCASGGTFKVKMVVYANNAGSPGALIAVSNEVANPATGWISFTFATPFNVTANTPYWLGYITDVGFSVETNSSTTGGSYGPRWGVNSGISYTSGPPSTLVGVSPTWTGTSNNLVNEYLQGTYGEYVFGSPEWTPASSSAGTGANATFVTQFLASDALSNVVTGYLRFSATASAAKCKMLVYNDNGSNQPGTLLAYSNELVGIVNGVNTFTFATPFNISAGTNYWLGCIIDTSVNAWVWNSSSYTVRSWWDQSTPYTSGPISPLYPNGASSFNQIAEIYLINGTGGGGSGGGVARSWARPMFWEPDDNAYSLVLGRRQRFSPPAGGVRPSTIRPILFVIT
jgi:hypothetical protein